VVISGDGAGPGCSVDCTVPGDGGVGGTVAEGNCGGRVAEGASGTSCCGCAGVGGFCSEDWPGINGADSAKKMKNTTNRAAELFLVGVMFFVAPQLLQQKLLYKYQSQCATGI